MSNTIKYLVTYYQEFNGDILKDWYVISVQSKRELYESINRLELDSHVFEVNYEVITENRYNAIRARGTIE